MLINMPNLWLLHQGVQNSEATYDVYHIERCKVERPRSTSQTRSILNKFVSNTRQYTPVGQIHYPNRNFCQRYPENATQDRKYHPLGTSLVQKAKTGNISIHEWRNSCLSVCWACTSRHKEVWRHSVSQVCHFYGFQETIVYLQDGHDPVWSDNSASWKPTNIRRFLPRAGKQSVNRAKSINVLQLCQVSIWHVRAAESITLLPIWPSIVLASKPTMEMHGSHCSS